MKWKDLPLIYYYQCCHRYCSARGAPHASNIFQQRGKSDGDGENKSDCVRGRSARVCVSAGESERAHLRVWFFSISFSFVRRTQGQCARRTAQGLANFTTFDAHTAVLPAGCGRVLALNVIFLVTRDELCWELHFIIMHLVRESN